MGAAAAAQPFENQADFGTAIDLQDGRRKMKFVVGKANSYRKDGWCLTSGEIVLTNGKRFWAILGICEMDSGEHYETYVPFRRQMKEQSEGFVGFLAPTQEEIFPYRYRYHATIAQDHHVGSDGWSHP